jgi:hypothetical protein
LQLVEVVYTQGIASGRQTGQKFAKKAATRWVSHAHGRRRRVKGGEQAGGRPAEEVVEYERLLGYLRNNEHRMDYPKYLRNGWQIATAAKRW